MILGGDILFENLKEFDGKTLILYICIVFFASILGYFYQKPPFLKKNKIIYFVASFAFVAFFAMFNTIGVDKDYGYKPLYSLPDKEILNSGMEFGFNLLTIFLKHISDSFTFYVATISFVTIALFYISFYKFRKRINVGLAILIFTCLFYFQQFNLMRIYLASGILLLGFIYLIRRKELRFLILLLITISIHYSAIFALLVYIIYKVLYRSGKLDMIIIYRNYFILLIVSFVAIIVMSQIIPLFKNIDYPFFAKVAKYYTKDIQFKIGFGFIFNILPYLFIFALFGKGYFSKRMKTIILSYFFMIVIVNFLAYSIPVIGRAAICMNAPLLLVIPYLYKKIKGKRYITLNLFGCKIKSNTTATRLLILSYFVLALFIYLNDYVISDGIANISYVWS